VNQRKAGNKESRALLHVSLLLGLLFDPEAGADMLLRNVGKLSTGYTVIYPRGYDVS
jgi:hypothetical protein